jgi:predicted metal-dependent phosphoesterase TrpH
MLFENPKKFGFHFKPIDLYEPYDYKNVIVENSIDDLAQFAIDNGTSYKMLKVVNPWLTSTKLTVSEGNSYVVQIPIGYVNEAYYQATFEEEKDIKE